MGKKRKKRQQDIHLSKQERAYAEKLRKQAGDDNVLTFVKYGITDEPLGNPWFEKLPGKVRERIDDLYDMMAMNPEQVIAEVSALIKKYPKVPLFYNYLSVAYSNRGEAEKRDAAILECYKRFPDYLFGRINYARLCLENGDMEKIPEIFDNKLDLGMLYPQRTTFHISEYAGFAGIVGLYYISIGERKPAKLYYKMLKKMAPDHHSTLQLKQALYPPLMVRLSRWLYKKITGREFSLSELEEYPYPEKIEKTDN